MATELLSPDITEVDSANVTVADGARATLFLTGPAAQGASMTGAIAVQMQAANAGWSNVYWMDAAHRTARIDGPATFRLRRFARDKLSLALGVDRA